MIEVTTLATNGHDSVSGVVRAGLLDWAADTAVDLRPVLQTVAITVAVLFVVYKAVQSKFAFGAIVVSALAAGVFTWAVHNVTNLSDTIGEDLPGGSGSDTAADPPATDSPDGDPADTPSPD